MMEKLLHSRGPYIVTVTIFTLGVCALTLVSSSAQVQVTDINRDSGYGLIATANAGQP